ncbi:HTH_Tnp_Tc3_2 domain-containing protein [Trichonephila clavipes]|nr:HTH_Tnp_Tc3_2 domain-containing protein [Trichonephila clavipes]
MSKRSRLPDSLSWMVVGWMEMGYYRLMLLDVLMRLVVRSTVSGINIRPKHLCPEDMFQADHELQHLQETALLTFQPEGEEGFLCRNLFRDHSVAPERRISTSTVRRRLHNLDLYTRRPIVCVPFNRQQIRAHSS